MKAKTRAKYKWIDTLLACTVLIFLVGLAIITAKAEESHHITLDQWVAEVHGEPEGSSLGDKVYAGLKSEVAGASSLIARYNSGGIDETQLARGILLIEGRISSISDALVWGSGQRSALWRQPVEVAESIDRAMVAALTKDEANLSEARQGLDQTMQTAHDKLAGYGLRGKIVAYTIEAIYMACILIFLNRSILNPRTPAAKGGLSNDSIEVRASRGQKDLGRQNHQHPREFAETHCSY